MSNLTGKYLKIDDDIIALKAEKKKLDDQIKALEAEKQAIGDEIISDFVEYGVVPDKGLSIRELKARPVVEDESKIPDAYFKETKERKLNKAELNKDFKNGANIHGVTWSEPSYSLVIVAQK